MDPAYPNLSTVPASRRHLVVAGVVAGALLGVALAVGPIVRMPLARLPGFVPIYASCVSICMLLTGYLLARDARLGRSSALLAIACGYLFTGLVAIGHLFTFPGALVPGLQLAGGIQTPAFLWIVWHVGFPLALVAYAGLAPSERPLSERAFARLRGRAIAITLTAALAITGIALLVPQWLPNEMIDGSYHPAVNGGDLLLIALYVALLVAITRVRPFTIARLWLTVACWAMLIDVVLAVVAGSRFSAGWYVGRLSAVVSASIVLAALLGETGRVVEGSFRGERRLRRVFEGVGDALLALDDDGRVVEANPAATALFAGGGEPLRGRLADDLVAAAPVPLEIASGEGVLIARDVTERLRADEAAAEAIARATESAEMRARFLATMSHEIRTPINAVVGMSELLLQTPLTEEGRDYALVVRDSAEALLSVINEVLDFSKIEAGATELERLPFSPVVAVENAADIIATTARRKGIALATFVAPDVPRHALGDAHRLRQILLNLLSNAVKFTAEGHVTVRAFVERVQPPRRVIVRFEVADTGPGIRADAMDRVFQPFRQGDAGTTRRHGGTGLGLSIAKRLVELLGGEIGVRSMPGRGTTFWFALPFERDGAADDAPSSRVRGSRVLVVDAEPTSRGVVEQYLLSWGAVASATASPAQAIELARSARERGAPYDVAIVADGDGVDAYAVLNRLRGDSGAPPAIFVSTQDTPGEAVEARRRGYAAYLRKPLKQSLLHDALGDALGALARAGEAIEPAARAVPVPGLRILVADDNAVNRKLTLQQLKTLGYAAQTVPDGRAAVAAARTGGYDLILMDCEMPELDGFEATRAIRRDEAEGRGRVTIVAMTANALEGDRERCLASGMDDYLAKPVQLAMLRDLLERRAAAPA